VMPPPLPQQVVFPIYGSSNCGVVGCTEGHSSHFCKNCGMSPSDHFTSDCTDPPDSRGHVRARQTPRPHTSLPNRSQCGVVGCTEGHSSHFCMNCGMGPSDHFTSDCTDPPDSRGHVRARQTPRPHTSRPPRLHTSMPNRTGCRVNGCTDGHSKHYCGNCGNSDSDHFMTLCTYPTGSWAPVRARQTPRPHTSLPNRSQCGVVGCTESHSSHLCRNCGMSPSDHLMSDCTDPPVPARQTPRPRFMRVLRGLF
jgi:hypothetical protein